jgi:hypothetical protein
MRRVNELPDSFATGVEGVDVDRHRQILKLTLCHKQEALKSLGQYLKLLAPEVIQPPVGPPPVTGNHTKVYLGSLSMEELRLLERILEKGALPSSCPCGTSPARLYNSQSRADPPSHVVQSNLVYQH